MGKKQKVKEQKPKKEAVIEDSKKNKHVFCVRKKGWLQGQKVKEGWYFWDEAGLLGSGPYATEKLASEALGEYAKQLDQPQVTHSSPIEDKDINELNHDTIDPMEVQKPLPSISDLLAWYLWDKLDNSDAPNSPHEVRQWIKHFFKKSPLQTQLFLESNYEDFAKEYRTVYSEWKHTGRNGGQK